MPNLSAEHFLFILFTAQLDFQSAHHQIKN
jgi:hypothetical protein